MEVSVVDVAVLGSVIAVLLYYLCTWNHDYWKKRGVAGPKPLPFFGTQMDVILARKSLPDFFKEMYRKFPDEPFIGLLEGSKPVFMIRDPDLIKQVMVKDFSIFHDRVKPLNENHVNPLEKHLFALGGVPWRQLRLKLTPTFTSGKMRRMFPLMLNCTQQLPGVLDGPAERGEEVEFKDLMARLTTDIIGTCAFGVECNSIKNPDTIFRQIGKKVLQVSLVRKIRRFFIAFVPKLVAIISPPQRSDVHEFFMDTVKETVEFREKNNVKRNDFMDMLIEIKKHGKIVDDSTDLKNDKFMKSAVNNVKEEDLEFTDELMAAQAFVFFLAGFDTSSSTMSHTLLEMAYNKDIQDAARQEVLQAMAKHGGLTYDAVMEMHYLDMVVAETLRKYPVLAFLMRITGENYQIPNTKVILEKGTPVFIPLSGLQHDPDIYPDPENFDPERFTKEAKASRHPYTYMPFGEGPRICIGQRFGLMQGKLGLAALLARYEFSLSEHTPKLPLTFTRGAFLTATDGGMPLKVTRLKDTPTFARSGSVQG